MKTAAKVFLIIGMIFSFYLIFPIVLGCITISKINKSSSISEIHKWGIISIFFVSALGGIFTLCIDEVSVAPENIVVKPVCEETVVVNKIDPSQKLRQLKKLYDEGIIDENTYNEKRKRYVEDL